MITAVFSAKSSTKMYHLTPKLLQVLRVLVGTRPVLPCLKVLLNAS